MSFRLLIGAGFWLALVPAAFAADGKRDAVGVPMTRPVLPTAPAADASHTSVFWHVQELGTGADGQVMPAITRHQLQLVPVERTPDQGTRLVPPPAGPAPDRVRTKLPTVLGD